MAKQNQSKTLIWSAAVVVLAFPVVPLLDHFGRPALERPVLFAILIMAVAVKVCRDLWGRPWFWITTITIAAFHVPLILSFPWGNRWVPATVIMALCIVDLLIILGVVGLIEKLIGKKKLRIEGAQ
jgi:hypothetical protein